MDEVYKISLTGNVSISQAEHLYGQLQEALLQEGSIEVDASGVERIDTAILQMFLAFRNELLKRHADFRWLKPSDHLVSSANLFGISEQLNLSGAAGD